MTDHIQAVGVIIVNSRVRGHYKIKGRDRQTLVFSATLAIPRRSTERKKKKKSTSSQETIGMPFSVLLLF